MRSHQILFWLSLSRIYFHFANINKVDFSVLLNWMKVQLDFISNFQDASRVLTLEHTWAWRVKLQIHLDFLNSVYIGISSKDSVALLWQFQSVKFKNVNLFYIFHFYAFRVKQLNQTVH